MTYSVDTRAIGLLLPGMLLLVPIACVKSVVDDEGGSASTNGANTGGAPSTNNNTSGNSGVVTATGGARQATGGAPNGGSATGGVRTTLGIGGRTTGGASSILGTGGRTTGGASSTNGAAGINQYPSGSVWTCNGSACPFGSCTNSISAAGEAACSDSYPGPVDATSTYCLASASGRYCLSTGTSVLSQLWYAVNCSSGSASVAQCLGGCGFVYVEPARCQ